MDRLHSRHKQPLKKVRVGNTHLGRGVFAQRPFSAGEVIAEVKGTVIDDPEFDSTYSIDLGGGLSLDPGPPFRFLNHSCDPNCRLFVLEHDPPEPVPQVFVETIRRLKPGDELTIDYGWPAKSAIPCGCRSRKCRGWVVDEAELPAVILANGPAALPPPPAAFSSRKRSGRQSPRAKGR
jgi:hypothetical protein